MLIGYFHLILMFSNFLRVFGYETNGVSLSRLSQGDKTWCLTVGHIDTTMDDLIELTHSSILYAFICASFFTRLTIVVEKRIHWDKSTADYQIVQNITPHIDVIYTQTKNHCIQFMNLTFRFS